MTQEKPARTDSDTPGAKPEAPAIDNPSGLASGLQPGGTRPGGGPGTSSGSLGTGGGSTGNAATGSPGTKPGA